ncbi:antitoxin VbhA family protein [Gordonia humi]|uniref:Antitoxin VbhA domain-containing protein n=1 Tax=Gordonia humi TaxID=686429 RepID=A0A840FF82_9ACTN|nr:antitoxin VbhA family protein [Gordonia humi]MBB4138107.1 hypothetical protein [Gordonia humi]
MSLTFEQQHADLLDRLNPAERRAVSQSFANGILEGWTPTRSDVELLVRHTLGELTEDEYRAQVIAAAAARHR